jgi:hypothetical protein
MKFFRTAQTARPSDNHRKKFWEEVAEREFETMDDEAKSQWAELR